MSAPDRPILLLAERPRSLVQLMAQKGKAGVIAAAIKSAFGLDLPPPGKWAAGGEANSIWIQPGNWLLEADPSPPGVFQARVAAAAANLGVAVDQSSGRNVIHLEGPPARSHPRDDLSARPPSAHLRARLGGGDASGACGLRDPSRGRKAELRPLRRLDLCAMADRGASRSFACVQRPV